MSMELTEKCKEIRKRLIEVVSKNGGHLGPNLGVVELTVCLNEVFNFKEDIVLFDVGHQAYVYKILTDRDDKFHTIRTRGGLSPFLDPSESTYDHFISGHAGTALAAGVGFATANPDKKVVVIVGDASISNGHSLEALNYVGYKKLDNIIVIVNDNDMSIGENVGFISKFLKKVISSGKYQNFREDVKSFIKRIKANRLKNTLERMERSLKGYVTPFYALESLGFRFFSVSEGNNVEKLLPMLRKVKDLKGPVILLVKTEKGKGYCFAEENKEKFHGIAPFNIETGDTYKSSVSYSEIFGNKILDLAREDKEIYTLSAAMIKGTGLDKFSKEFPDRCIDTGIAEGFAVTFSAGLARSQKKPYVCIYSTFIQRAISQLIHDVSIQNLPVRFIIDRSGIVGEDGKTHNGIYDLSFFLTIQNFTVLCPTTAKELEEALELSKDFNSGPLVIRIPRDSVFNIEDDKPLEIGRWKEIKKGSKNLFIATGTMLKIILEIHEELKNRGIDATIVSAASVKPLDENYLLNYIKEYDNIFVLEENYVKNSFATSILEFLNDNGINKIIHRIALDSAIIPHGKRDELLAEERLKGESLIERIEEFVYGRKK
ncbi:1-deoxy-D-xylulose-5-phosphate synthase [Fusobacterium pseudoperiodonticum]|uniref:1-deoxy-D-xylulose-5-phosphate synthase n=1 Tax=Fusobacterium pseudoperiodonticum TaxID=2663009 RepID=A0AAD0AQE6_9FUSO|nr:1-deoxy-D-xylulose-5-phosphate synthase [Fusobacterium pseudoperiodonticum]ATV65720.1 1-deoxy-D-xylulose-5-phosphate synthase [Fusobacterium pseudoperiodonticum]